MAEHTCHARGCETAVPPRMFLCRRHWYRLPKPMRNRVWAAYRPGQETDKRPSREYLDVTTEAINWLAAREAAEAP